MVVAKNYANRYKNSSISGYMLKYIQNFVPNEISFQASG